MVHIAAGLGDGPAVQGPGHWQAGLGERSAGLSATVTGPERQDDRTVGVAELAAVLSQCFRARLT